MATTFTTSNRLADLLQGDPGTRDNWGTPNSENTVLVDSALDGLATVNIAGQTTFTLSANSGQPDQSRERFQSYTGALTGACTVTVPNVQKWGYARNLTTGGQNVVLSTGSGTTMTLPPDGAWHLYWTDGATNVSSLSLSFGNLAVGNLTASTVATTGNASVGGNLAVTGTTTLTGALAASSTISLPNNTAIRMADTLGNQQPVLTLDNTNVVRFSIAGNNGWRFLDSVGADAIRILANGTTIINGTAVNKDCTVSLQGNTGGGGAITVSSLPVPAHTSFTSFVSSLNTLQASHAIFTFQTIICGSIQTGAGNTTLYNTSSDATLKIDDGPMDDVGRIIDRLKPRWFRWKSAPGEESQPGFFAQQVHRVFPWAVSKGRGSKANYIPWQMDNSKLVPLLVAETQALRRRVRELERCRSGR